LQRLVAEAELSRGGLVASLEALRAVLARWTVLWRDLPPAIELLARWRLADGDAERAAELIGLADATRDRMGYSRFGWRLAAVDEAQTAARAALGDPAFAAAYERGRRLDLRTELDREAREMGA